MAGENIVEDLSKAYSTEIAGYYFYNAAAEMISDNKGKSVFSNLAKEEFDHIRVISKIGEAVKGGFGWIGYEDALEQAISERRGLPIFQGENELIKRLKTNPTDTNAVQIAMENEEGAVEFYSRLLKEAGTPIEKVVLTRLLEMEKGHLKVLRWESESLLKTGFWCGEFEYSVEKEIDA